jgi:queuine tRNA-ribosyltransferase
VIVYDPFSYKTNHALWTLDIFSRIVKRGAPRSKELYTYSASTAVRGALLAAGFFVAQGIGTGPKADTTIAFTGVNGSQDHRLFPRLLDHSWLTRWRRSAAKFPANMREQEKSHFERLIERHPQFSANL